MGDGFGAREAAAGGDEGGCVCNGRDCGRRTDADGTPASPASRAIQLSYDEEASDAEDKFQAELAAERAGKSFAEFTEEKATAVAEAKKAEQEADEEAPKVLTKKERRAAEELERQKALMSKKHKRYILFSDFPPTNRKKEHFSRLDSNIILFCV